MNFKEPEYALSQSMTCLQGDLKGIEGFYFSSAAFSGHLGRSYFSSIKANSSKEGVISLSIADPMLVLLVLSDIFNQIDDKSKGVIIDPSMLINYACKALNHKESSVIKSEELLHKSIFLFKKSHDRLQDSSPIGLSLVYLLITELVVLERCRIKQGDVLLKNPIQSHLNCWNLLDAGINCPEQILDLKRKNFSEKVKAIKGLFKGPRNKSRSKSPHQAERNRRDNDHIRKNSPDFVGANRNHIRASSRTKNPFDDDIDEFPNNEGSDMLDLGGFGAGISAGSQFNNDNFTMGLNNQSFSYIQPMANEDDQFIDESIISDFLLDDPSFEQLNESVFKRPKVKAVEVEPINQDFSKTLGTLKPLYEECAEDGSIMLYSIINSMKNDKEITKYVFKSTDLVGNVLKYNHLAEFTNKMYFAFNCSRGLESHSVEGVKVFVERICKILRLIVERHPHVRASTHFFNFNLMMKFYYVHRSVFSKNTPLVDFNCLLLESLGDLFTLNNSAKNLEFRVNYAEKLAERLKENLFCVVFFSEELLSGDSIKEIEQLLENTNDEFLKSKYPQDAKYPPSYSILEMVLNNYIQKRNFLEESDKTVMFGVIQRFVYHKGEKINRYSFKMLSNILYQGYRKMKGVDGPLNQLKVDIITDYKDYFVTKAKIKLLETLFTELDNAELTKSLANITFVDKLLERYFTQEDRQGYDAELQTMVEKKLTLILKKAIEHTRENGDFWGKKNIPMIIAQKSMKLISYCDTTTSQRMGYSSVPNFSMLAEEVINQARREIIPMAEVDEMTEHHSLSGLIFDCVKLQTKGYSLQKTQERSEEVLNSIRIVGDKLKEYRDSFGLVDRIINSRMLQRIDRKPLLEVSMKFQNPNTLVSEFNNFKSIIEKFGFLNKLLEYEHYPFFLKVFRRFIYNPERNVEYFLQKRIFFAKEREDEVSFFEEAPFDPLNPFEEVKSENNANNESSLEISFENSFSRLFIIIKKFEEFFERITKDLTYETFKLIEEVIDKSFYHLLRCFNKTNSRNLVEEFNLNRGLYLSAINIQKLGNLYCLTFDLNEPDNKLHAYYNFVQAYRADTTTYLQNMKSKVIGDDEICDLIRTFCTVVHLGKERVK